MISVSVVFFCVVEPKRLLQLSNISRFECQKESFGMDEFIFIYDLLSIGGLGKSITKWAESPKSSIAQGNALGKRIQTINAPCKGNCKK